MISKDGVIARLILTFCLFFLSGSQIITGTPATFCGIIGTIFLASALLRYSPLYELYGIVQEAKTDSSTSIIKEKELKSPLFNNNKRPA